MYTGSSKQGGVGAYMEMGAYLGDYGTLSTRSIAMHHSCTCGFKRIRAYLMGMMYENRMMYLMR